MNSPKILLATTNPTKIEKMKEILDGLDFTYLTPNDVHQTIEVKENEESFEKNAIKKR